MSNGEMVPKEAFFTKGVGRHRNKLQSFELALRAAGIEICHHQAGLSEHADAIFVHDPVLVTERGAVILRMGKAARRGEEEAMRRRLEELGVPTLGVLAGDATALHRL